MKVQVHRHVFTYNLTRWLSDSWFDCSVSLSFLLSFINVYYITSQNTTRIGWWNPDEYCRKRSKKDSHLQVLSLTFCCMETSEPTDEGSCLAIFGTFVGWLQVELFNSNISYHKSCWLGVDPPKGSHSPCMTFPAKRVFPRSLPNIIIQPNVLQPSTKYKCATKCWLKCSKISPTWAPWKMGPLTLKQTVSVSEFVSLGKSGGPSSQGMCW